MNFSESFPALTAFDCHGLTLKNFNAKAFGASEDIKLENVKNSNI